jgi:hypothetical protein
LQARARAAVLADFSNSTEFLGDARTISAPPTMPGICLN